RIDQDGLLGRKRQNGRTRFDQCFVLERRGLAFFTLLGAFAFARVLLCLPLISLASTSSPSMSKDGFLASTASRFTGAGAGTKPWTRFGLLRSLPCTRTSGWSRNSSSICCKAFNRCRAV